MTNRQAAIKIIKKLKCNGYEALLAGGCVRDMLLKRPAKDYDVATNAEPADVIRLFKRTLKIGAKFGVVMVLIDRTQVEVGGPTRTQVAVAPLPPTPAQSQRNAAVTRVTTSPRRHAPFGLGRARVRWTHRCVSRSGESAGAGALRRLGWSELGVGGGAADAGAVVLHHRPGAVGELHLPLARLPLRECFAVGLAEFVQLLLGRFE